MLTILLLCTGGGLAVGPLAEGRAVPRKQVWFAPGPASPDLLALFRDEKAWATARERVAVFKFYQQHVMDPPPPIVEGNTYDAIVGAEGFRTVKVKWRRHIALEVGAVKAHYCSPDGAAEAHAVRDSIAAIRAVEEAGGRVTYLAMDEPFLAAASIPACGAPNVDAGVDRVVEYVQGVQRAYPGVAIGLIEPWPYLPAATIARVLTALRARGVPMRFFHADIGVDQIDPGEDFAAEMRYLASVCAAQQTRFGMIIHGDSGQSNAAYMAGAMERVRMTADAFADWPEMPQDVIFQSWAQEQPSGRFITPTNLPETTTDTHTSLVNRATPLLHGPEHYRAVR